MNSLPYSPGLDGVIATITRISDLKVDPQQIIVRGYDLIELVKNLGYTDAAYLLFYGKIPDKGESDAFGEALKAEARLPKEVYQLFDITPKCTTVPDILRTGISFLAGFEDPNVLADTSRDQNIRKGLRILAKMPTILANAYRVTSGGTSARPHRDAGFIENFLWMIKGKKPDPEVRDVFERVLMCYIEREMSNCAFTARVVASTLSDIYAAITASIASDKGPLHGGASQAVISMLLEIQRQGGADKAEDYIKKKMREKARILGFGHRVFMRAYDPRANFLKNLIQRLVGLKKEGKELHAIYQRVEEVIFREKGIYPNSEYPTALLFYLLDIPSALWTPILTCATVPGFIAHIMEQHEEIRLFRPRALYKGPQGLRLQKKL